MFNNVITSVLSSQATSNTNTSVAYSAAASAAYSISTNIDESIYPTESGDIAADAATTDNGQHNGLLVRERKRTARFSSDADHKVKATGEALGPPPGSKTGPKPKGMMNPYAIINTHYASFFIAYISSKTQTSQNSSTIQTPNLNQVQKRIFINTSWLLVMFLEHT